MTKSLESFLFDIPLEIEEGKRVLGLTCLEVHNFFSKHLKKTGWYFDDDMKKSEWIETIIFEEQDEKVVGFYWD